MSWGVVCCGRGRPDRLLMTSLGSCRYGRYDPMVQWFNGSMVQYSMDPYRVAANAFKPLDAL